MKAIDTTDAATGQPEAKAGSLVSVCMARSGSLLTNPQCRSPNDTSPLKSRTFNSISNNKLQPK